MTGKLWSQKESSDWIQILIQLETGANLGLKGSESNPLRAQKPEAPGQPGTTAGAT